MRISYKKQYEDKYYLNITFIDEVEEQGFLKRILDWFGKSLPINCMITDFDTDYSLYKEYFEKSEYYVLDRITTQSIFAFKLNNEEVGNVISNWGYYTISALFALGEIDNKTINQRLDISDLLMSMPIVISQILDNSIEIISDAYYLNDVVKFLV